MWRESALWKRAGPLPLFFELCECCWLGVGRGVKCGDEGGTETGERGREGKGGERLNESRRESIY